MSVHNDQIVSVLTRALQEVLSRGLNDPRVRGLLSVTKVKVSPDQAAATVWVSVLPAEHADLSMHGLKSAATHIRRQVGERVRIRRMPQLHFKLDQSIKREAGILHAIEEARRADAAKEEGAAPTERKIEDSDQ
ncbi:MAG: 30S ribosome-binding factor RbfA [Phycisphaerales bacterium]|nr:30S ribosome-binding factor RbfA [Phycisphaerales bacterium]NNM26752.1 30S ribosome-binding factor RbfA [Phycisphaerales bacterium]